MTFNNTINHLKKWCSDKSTNYHDQYNNSGGVFYIAYNVIWELEFKLSSLTDKEFDSIEDFKNIVLGLIDVHYDRSVIEPPNNIAVRMIEKVNDEFRLCLSDIIFDIDNLPYVNLPYRRVILGNEATELISNFEKIWDYENTSYWFPLMGEKPMHVSEKFFVMFDYLEPYLSDLFKLIGLPTTRIYEYSEKDIWPDHIIETVEIADYGGHETIYTDKDFSWAIYYSHEDTVAFAGTIVPKVKELLKNDKEHWDKFEWN